MFVRIDLVNRFFPSWKTVDYINPSNILRMTVKNNTLDIYTIFRPKYSAQQIVFNSNENALAFAEKCLHSQSPPIVSIPKKEVERLDQAAVDPLALSALADWDESEKQKQLK